MVHGFVDRSSLKDMNLTRYLTREKYTQEPDFGRQKDSSFSNRLQCDLEYMR
jgi:hypothetical protein